MTTILRKVAGAVFRAAVLASLAAGVSGAQQQRTATADVFRRYADRVFKIQVVENGSAAKAGLGSGFVVTAAGHVVTNYHVIARVVSMPKRYHAVLMDSAGNASPVSVLAIDVVHDLAVLTSNRRNQAFFAVHNTSIVQGNRLFSLGHPHDLGLSIVEGTYNGLLSNTLYPRVHLTGSLNPGMSGGPTIDENGEVIGVNVSTEGNQVSFLVPADQVALLLAGALAMKSESGTASLATVGQQLTQYQNQHLRTLFDSSTSRIALGPYRVVTQPAPFFRCWGDVVHRPNLPYERTQHACSTEDDIFLDDDQPTGTINLEHELVTTKTMGAVGFFEVYSQLFGNDMAPAGEEEFVTSWKCQTRNVKNGTLTMRAAFCLRRYRELGELYDLHLKIAALGRSNVGLISTLNMTGLTFANANALADRYLRSITWR